MAVLALGALSFAGWGFYLAHDQHIVLIPDPIVKWGEVVGTRDFYTIVDTSVLNGYKEKFEIMLICRVTDNGIDYKHDTAIRKSDLFSIDGTAREIITHTDAEFMTKLYASGGGYVERYLVLWPNGLSPDKLSVIGEIEQLGGKMVTSRASFVSVGRPAKN